MPLKLDSYTQDGTVQKKVKLGAPQVNQRPEYSETVKESVSEQQAADPFTQAREALYGDFIQDMVDSAIDIEVNEEQQRNAEKRYKQLVMKKRVLLGSVVFGVLVMTFFGVYNTFMKHELTYQEIAYIANTYNGRSNFANDGVQGYLSTNMPGVISSQLTALSKVSSVEVLNPTLSKISHKNNNYANVYFYVTLKTNIGEQRVDCMVPMYWSESEWTYKLAGSVVFTPAATVDSNTEMVDNPFLSFEGINTASADDTSRAKSFLDNFFQMLYDGKDISPYYSGETLYPGDMKYVSMEEFVLYTANNANNFNAYAKIQVQSDNGLLYTTVKWMHVEKSGQSWIITALT